jgi:hypothetical protein
MTNDFRTVLAVNKEVVDQFQFSEVNLEESRVGTGYSVILSNGSTIDFPVFNRKSDFLRKCIFIKADCELHIVLYMRGDSVIRAEIIAPSASSKKVAEVWAQLIKTRLPALEIEMK